MITRTAVMQWRTDSITKHAEAIDNTGGALFSSGKATNEEFAQLTETWAGDASTAAGERAGSEWQQTRTIATMIEDVAEDIKRAHFTLGSTCAALQDLVREIGAQSATVTDSWEVQALADVDEGVVIAWQTRINHLVGDLTAQDNALAARLDAFTDEFGRAIPHNSGHEPGAGARLGDALAEAITTNIPYDSIYGRIPTELAQSIGEHLEDVGLTPRQLEALAAGEPVAASPDQLMFMNKFVEHAGMNGLLALSRHYADEGTEESAAHQTALANAVLAVSNENIGTGIAGREVRGPGGFEQIPDDLHELIHWNRDADRYPGTSEMTALRDFADLLEASDATYPPGEELGAHLVDRAADFHALGYEAEHHVLEPRTTPYPMRGEYDGIAQTFTEIGTRNEDSSAAILTGTYSDGHELPGYDRDTAVGWLLLEGGEPAEKLIDWIQDDATSPNLDTAQRAGEAAFGLASAISSDDSGINGNNHNAFLNLPDRDGQSLGQHDPSMTRAIANALTPYIADIGLIERGLLTTRGFSDMVEEDSMRLFSVIDSNSEVAEDWNSSVYTAIEEIEDRYVASMLYEDQSLISLGGVVGRLQEYVVEGYLTEVDDRNADRQEAVDAQRAAIERTGTVTGSVLSFLPHAGPAMGGATGLLAEGYSSHSVPNVEPMDIETGARSKHVDARHYYNLLVSLDARGALEADERIDKYRGDDGAFLPYDDALFVDNARSSESAKADKFEENIYSALDGQGHEVSEFIGKIRTTKDDLEVPK
ncbi:TPR repeat region-containing protein [Lolliginicoccus suaedae]|uniref:TPR repeat region-containing protein n=1 Tax=Lolliginicoccus suaedae TaxID=2605429 RepID=UPI0011EE00BC|nr:hypothetical protein [Lolliginicoccus suaedae]